jgi:TolA-binding protein
MKTISIVATLVLAAGFLPAAAAAQNREHVQMAAELRVLQEQQAQLALAIAQLTQAFAEAMKTLNVRVDESNKSISDAMRKGFADQSVGISQMSGDVRVIREGTQATATQLGRLREEIEALRTSLPSLLTRLPALAPVTDPLDPNAPPPVAPVLPDVAPPPPVSTVGISPERLYSTAQSDYASGQFVLAIGGFEQYIRTFPTSDRADDAQQGIGDAENQQGRFEEAIAAYNRVIQNYPKGDQVPWAYYKRALAMLRLERRDEARVSLELAIKTAPGADSQVAVLAKQVLDGLTRAAPAAPATKRP